MDPSSRATCQFRKENGELCKRSVNQGEDRCWQHAHSLRSKWKSLTRNQTILFFGTIATIVALPVAIVSFLWGPLHPAPSKEEIANEVVRHLPTPPVKREVEKEPQEPSASPPGSSSQQNATKQSNNKVVNSPRGTVPAPSQAQLPAFAIAVETKMMVPSPSKDSAGTGLWALSRNGSNCYLRSVDTAMFIRIKNLQPTKVMITAYNVYGMGGELHRIRMDMNDPFMILKEGIIPRHFQGGASLSMPAPTGNAGGGFFQVPFKDSDFSAAATIQGELLDRQLGEHYIEPGATVRGWAFFEYNSIAAMPVMLTINVDDDLGHSFSYRIPDEPGNPSGDTLLRVLNFGPVVDLSSCIRQPHPEPSR